MGKIAKAFEDQYLFRRGMLLIEFLAGLWITYLSYNYIMHATTLNVAGAEIAGVVTVLQAPVTAIFLYSFRMYTAERSKKIERDN